MAIEWSLLSNHGLIMTTIARRPDLRLREIAAQVGITERAVQTLVGGDLVRAGYLERIREGRRNRYVVRGDQPITTPGTPGQRAGRPDHRPRTRAAGRPHPARLRGRGPGLQRLLLSGAPSQHDGRRGAPRAVRDGPPAGWGLGAGRPGRDQDPGGAGDRGRLAAAGAASAGRPPGMHRPRRVHRPAPGCLRRQARRRRPAQGGREPRPQAVGPRPRGVVPRRARRAPRPQGGSGRWIGGDALRRADLGRRRLLI